MTAQTKAEDKSIEEILYQKHYSIDYYQRGYVWEKQHAMELLDDFLAKFFEDYQEGHDASSVRGYGRYFLGSLILSNEDTETYIIDGQQRLTTLMLLFIALSHYVMEKGIDLNDDVDNFFYSNSYGEKRFNISTPEREPVLFSLINYPETKVIPIEYADNILKKRYLDLLVELRKRFNQSVDAVKPFYYWIKNKVMMVQITAGSQKEAYTIFETMNDRGKALTPLEMFKGYTLALIEDRYDRQDATRIWNETESRLKEHSVSLDTFIVSLLQSKFAAKIDGKKSDAGRGDWSVIAKSCHRWFRENRHKPYVGMRNSNDVYSFIKSFDYYSDLYLRITQYIATLTPGYESVFMFGRIGDIAHQSLMAFIDENDPEEMRKLNLMAFFMDYKKAQYSWGTIKGYDESIAVEVLIQTASRLRKRVDNDDIHVLAWELKKLADNYYRFSTSGYPLYKEKSAIASDPAYYFIARITDFLEVQSGKDSIWHPLTLPKKKGEYQINHLFEDDYEAYKDKFSSPEEFSIFRDKSGALGLVPKSSNLQKEAYETKLDKYPNYNVFLGLLSPTMYNEDGTIKNEGLQKLQEKHPQLAPLMKPCIKLDKQAIINRDKLIYELSVIIWDVLQILEYTDFDSFEDLEEYALDESTPEDEETTESITTSLEKHGIKAGPGETLDIQASITRRISPVKTIKTHLYGKVNDEGLVKIEGFENLRLDEETNSLLSASLKRLWYDIKNGVIGTTTKNKNGTYNWIGQTVWMKPSAPLGLAKNSVSDITPWKLSKC